MTANGETESKNEALFVNYSFRHMSIGTSSSFTYSHDKITLSSIHTEKDFTRNEHFFFNLLKFPRRGDNPDDSI